MKSWKERTMFRDLVESDKTVQQNITPDDIGDAFNLNHHNRNVDRIFERVGLE